MDWKTLLFCVLSLAGSLLIAVLFFPLASISKAELEASQKTTPAEEMADLDLGDYGTVPMLDLVEYYMENPPVLPSGEAPVRKVRFQGC